MKIEDIIARRSGGSASIKRPAVGENSISGVAQPYAAVEVFKNSNGSAIGVAFADVNGAWTLPLPAGAAVDDVYRVSGGGTIVTGAPAGIGPAVASFSTDATPDTIITTLINVPAGVSIASVAPNDGRVVARTGNALAVGPSASTAGSKAYTVTFSNGVTHTITLTATAPSTLPPPTRYSDPDNYYFAGNGMRWPNKQGTIATGFTKLAGSMSGFRSGPFTLPQNSKLLVGFPNVINREGDPLVNELYLPSDVTIEAFSVTFTDGSNTTRTIAAESLSNNGVLSASVTNGGVLVTIPLDAAALPANTPLKFNMAFSGGDGFSMHCCYETRSGDVWRKHATDSFAALVNSGASPSGLSGAVSASLLDGNGQSTSVFPGPCFIAGKGADGRPVFYGDGDSILYGKGTNDAIAPDHVAGVADPAFVRTANGYAIPMCNSSVAGSGFVTTDPARPEYDTTIHNGRRALIGQVIALNGGKPPFTHHFSEHGTNSIQNNVADQVRMIKARHTWLQEWVNVPVIRTTMLPKASTSDGFRTVENQTPNTGGVRVGFSDEVLGNKLGGTILYPVDIHSAVVANPATVDGRQRWAVGQFTATLTRATASGAGTIYLNKSPPVGMALSLDPLAGGDVRVVVSSTLQGTGDYAVATTSGASSGTYAAKAVDTLVAETIPSDGKVVGTSGGLHLSKIANDTIAAWQGAYSYDAMKQFLRSQVNGTWATNWGGTVAPTAPTVTSPITATVVENTAYSATLTSDKPGVVWSKGTGEDAALFTLTGASLSLSARDFEAPADTTTAGTNTYICPLIATDPATNLVTTFNYTVTISNDTNEPVTFSARTTQILSQYTTLPSATIQNAIDARVKALEAIPLTAGGTLNFYSLIDADYSHAALDSAASLINWANPTGPKAALTTGASSTPSFTPFKGWIENTATAYGTSFIDYGYDLTSLPGAKMVRDSATLLGYATTFGTYSGFDVIDRTNGRFNLKIRKDAAGQIKVGVNTTTSAVIDGVLAPVQMCGIRRDATTQLLYRDGALNTTGAVASTSPITDVQLAISDRILAIVSLGAALPSDEVVAKVKDINKTYLQAIGAFS